VSWKENDMSMEFILEAALRELPPAERQAVAEVAKELRRMADQIYENAEEQSAEDHAQYLLARGDAIRRAADILQWG
jgi:hypothetical protein